MVRIPRNVTICPDCAREVGVQPPWNRSVTDKRLPSENSWRVSRHGRAPGGPQCPGSRALVSAVNVWPHDSKAETS